MRQATGCARSTKGFDFAEAHFSFPLNYKKEIKVIFILKIMEWGPHRGIFNTKNVIIKKKCQQSKFDHDSFCFDRTPRGLIRSLL